MLEQYIPGICNLGNQQLMKRKRFAAKSAGFTVWAIVLLQLFSVPPVWRLCMLIPFSVTALALQQVYYKFCYVFGLKGYYGLNLVGQTNKVTDAESLKLDRAKAHRMIVSSVFIGTILALIYYLLPV